MVGPIIQIKKVDKILTADTLVTLSVQKGAYKWDVLLYVLYV